MQVQFVTIRQDWMGARVLNFVKGPTQVQFFTIQGDSQGADASTIRYNTAGRDRGREGLILSRGRRRYNFSQYRGTVKGPTQVQFVTIRQDWMGKRHLNFAPGAGAPSRGRRMGHEVRDMRWGTC